MFGCRKRIMGCTVGLVLIAGTAASAGSPPQPERPARSEWRFGFGRGVRSGFTPVHPDTAYSATLTYGLLAAADLEEHAHSLCGRSPWRFAADVPEGNFDVLVELGDDTTPSLATIYAEARRLFVERVEAAPGRTVPRTFSVNVRYSELASGEAVRLKNDEQNDFDWDHRLVMEFSNAHPCVRTLTLRRNPSAITVYLAGDSTVTDQRREPWAAWGQMLPRFFQRGVVVANHAESGESLKSFVGEKRLAKIMETIHAGDYLFIQFAHNDQKPGASHVDAATTYKEWLRKYIEQTRSKGAAPVLVTSMHRRRFDDQGRIVNTLGDYPDAMRELGKEQGLAVIDLNACSQTLFETLGPQGTLRAFVHYPANAFPRQDKELADDTHFTSYGAYELARCVVEGIRARGLGLAEYLDRTVPHFEPEHPDPVERWNLPRSFMTPEITR